MEGFNYGNFKSELRGLLTTRVLETFCDALPSMTGVVREKILDQRNTNALLSFLENHGYMGETRGISKLAAFCSQTRGLATVAELCENFCPSIGKTLNEREGDIMEFNVTEDSLMLFAREHQNIIYSSWTDLKNHFEVSRAKRGVKSSQSIQWLDLDRLGPAERAVRLFADAHALGQLDMLVEVLSRRQVPLHRVFVSTFGRKSSSSSSFSTPMLDLPPPFLNKVCVACTRTWEDIAWHMGYRNSDDRLVFGQSRVPMTKVLEDHWASSGKKITVGEFIDVLSRMERPRNDVIAMLQGAPLSSSQDSTTPPQAASLKFMADSFSSSSSSMNPLAAAIASQQRQVVTTQSFLQDSSNALRNSLLLAMDESEAWFALLAAKNLLHGPEMEKWVAGLRKEWTASRANEPSLQVVRNLCQHDAEFARGTLVDLANLLNALKIPAVTQAISKAVEFYEGKQAKTQEKSSTAFSAQGELRAWLVQNGICEEEEVDSLVLKLRGEGVRNVADLQGFDKDDLKELGFSTRQAIAVVKKISNAK